MAASASWARRSRRPVVDERVVASDAVGIGSKVEIEDEQGERMQVEIASVGGVSPDSPLGRALLGSRAGDEVEIEGECELNEDAKRAQKGEVFGVVEVCDAGRE
jgi:transcription elongation GreA/GreB family factor